MTKQRTILPYLIPSHLLSAPIKSKHHCSMVHCYLGPMVSDAPLVHIRKLLVVVCRFTYLMTTNKLIPASYPLLSIPWIGSYNNQSGWASMALNTSSKTHGHICTSYYKENFIFTTQQFSFLSLTSIRS